MIGPMDPRNDLWGQFVRLAVPHDRAVEGLQGYGLPGAISAWGPVVSDILLAFSSVALAMAALWVVWQTIVTVTNAAWSGEAISREWHSIWGPLRVVLGLGALAPIANGSNLVQLAVIQVSLFSGQAGNAIYAAVEPNILRIGEMGRAQIPDVEIARIADHVAIIDLCYRVAAQSVASSAQSGFLGGFLGGGEASSPGRQPQPMFEFRAETTQSGVRAVGLVPVAGASAFARSCPGLELVVSRVERGNRSADVYEQVARHWVDALQDIAGRFGPLGADLLEASLGAMEARSVSGRDFAAEYRTWRAEAVERWREAQARVAATWLPADALEKRRTELKGYGWLGIPLAIFALTREVRDSVALQTAVPQVTEQERFDALLRGRGLGARLQAYGAVVQPIVSEFLRDPTPGFGGLPAVGGDAAFRTVAWVVRTLGVFPEIDLAKGRAILQVADWGYQMMTVGTVLWGLGITSGLVGSALGAAASVAGGAAAGAVAGPAGGALGSALGLALGKVGGATLGFLQLLGGAMILIGILHAYVLPLLPVLFMILFATGSLILMVEALLAAPIWALAHVSVQGRSMIDHTQAPGYEILLSLFIRIPIAVMAFVFSTLTTDVGLYAIHLLFRAAFQDYTSGGAGLFGLAAFLIIVTYLTWALCLRSYGMITDLPDRVLRWIRIQSPQQGVEEVRGTTQMAVLALSRSGGIATAATQAAIGARPGGTPPALPGSGRGFVGPATRGPFRR